jgi:protein-S-isoprenylcysteine O-methyltransferase Ste14
MAEPAAGKALELLLGTVAFGCFAWGTIWYFKWEANGSRGAWAISLLSWAGYLNFVWQTIRRPAPAGWPVVCTLTVASLMLWAWTLHTARADPPTLAYTEDTPKVIFQSGPYRFVRHPFYSAYLLFWLAATLAAPGLVGALILLVLIAVYLAAARHEEAKFARSDCAAGYEPYRGRAGMFLPRLLRR